MTLLIVRSVYQRRVFNEKNKLKPELTWLEVCQSWRRHMHTRVRAFPELIWVIIEQPLSVQEGPTCGLGWGHLLVFISSLQMASIFVTLRELIPLEPERKPQARPDHELKPLFPCFSSGSCRRKSETEEMKRVTLRTDEKQMDY